MYAEAFSWYVIITDVVVRTSLKKILPKDQGDEERFAALKSLKYN